MHGAFAALSKQQSGARAAEDTEAVASTQPQPKACPDRSRRQRFHSREDASEVSFAVMQALKCRSRGAFSASTRFGRTANAGHLIHIPY